MLFRGLAPIAGRLAAVTRHHVRTYRVATSVHTAVQQAVAATPSELSAGPRVRDYLAAQPEPADVATGNALLHVLAHKALVDEARTVYEHMKTTGVACDAQTYASLIHGAGRAGRPELAQEYHDEMVARGVQGSVAVYGALATAWRDVSLDKAAGVLDVMRKHGVRPNEVVYTAVLKACTIHRNYDRAWEVFGDMRYWNVAPDEVTYSTMITACAKAREAERALLLFDEMREKGLAVGIEVYGAVMHALSLRFDMHVRVFELLHSMKGAAVNPDERIVASLLHSCGTVGNVKAAHAVWNNMTRADSRLYICDPSLRMHNSLLKTYANAIRSRVPEVLERLTSTHEVVLNVEETATVVRAESIDHMHAAAVASANRNVEEEAGDGALVTMADAFPSLDTREEWAVGELLDAGHAVLASIRARGLAPDIYTANAILEARTWGMQLPAALDMLYSMEERLGVAPNAESYRMVVGLCIKMDQFNTAFDVWEHMQRALPGRAHDKGTYKHLMFGCEKFGAYSQLVRVATAMVGAGIVPAPTELMQLRERLLRTKQERVWDDIKALCMKADKSNLWAIKDAQYRKELAKYRPFRGKSRHKRRWEK